MGEPRYQPSGYALFSRVRRCFWNCGGGWRGLVRSVWDEQAAELLVNDLIAPLSEYGYHINSAVDDTGTVIAASMCVQGDCGGVGAPSPDALQELWVSRDGGVGWETWGTVPPLSLVVQVTEDDVALKEWGLVRDRVRWFRSGQVFAQPDDERSWVVDWDGDVPIWGEWRSPLQPPALAALGQLTWRELQTRLDGSTVLWAASSADLLLLLAVVNEQNAVEEVYGWPNADYVDWLVPMGDGLFAGFRMEGGYAIGRDHVNFLIDLPTRTVHPLLGLPDGEEGFAEPWRAIPLTTE